jgi:hypothetical protein
LAFCNCSPSLSIWVPSSLRPILHEYHRLLKDQSPQPRWQPDWSHVFLL